MRIIHIAGRSGSGKTTFIRSFGTLLCRYGRVGTIKHLGHHSYLLPEGKDTTLHYATGAEMTIGIDDEKMIAQIRSPDLDRALDLLADQGMDYAIIEGFKAIPFTKVIFGDLEGTAVFRNPEPEELIEHLTVFDEYHTLQSLMRLVNLSDASLMCAGYRTDIPPGDLDRAEDLKSGLLALKGDNTRIQIHIHVQKPVGSALNGSFMMVAGGKEYGSILLYLMRAAGVIRDTLGTKGETIRLPPVQK